ncbi:MAG: hypothetical protein AB7P12_06345 [Alphaproteobacteria bacterium]
MFMLPNDAKRLYAPHGAAADDARGTVSPKWSARKTLVFVTSTSCILWAIIISTFSHVF